MRRTILATAWVLTWSAGTLADASHGADADSSRFGGGDARRSVQTEKERANPDLRVARDESASWSEPIYRYGRREPALEELRVTGDLPETGRAVPATLPH